jgi:hypothetical protein
MGMFEFLSKEVREGLDLARKRALGRKSRLRVHVDGQIYPVRRLWDAGFSLDSDGAPFLRGRVDLYDGARQLCECLVIASEEANGETIYEFKRATAVATEPPRDFSVDENAPVALIGRA